MFTLIKNESGDFNLYVNGFLIDGFSIQRDYYKIQKFEEEGKLIFYDMCGKNLQHNLSTEENEMLNLFKDLLKGAKDDNESDS